MRLLRMRWKRDKLWSIEYSRQTLPSIRLMCNMGRLTLPLLRVSLTSRYSPRYTTRLNSPFMRNSTRPQTRKNSVTATISSTIAWSPLKEWQIRHSTHFSCCPLMMRKSRVMLSTAFLSTFIWSPARSNVLRESLMTIVRSLFCLLIILLLRLSRPYLLTVKLMIRKLCIRQIMLSVRWLWKSMILN